MAKPCRLLGNQRATYGVPTENEPPTSPTSIPSSRNCHSRVASATNQIGTTVASISRKNTMRPPKRSVHMPSGTRASEPVRMGVAAIRPNSVSDRPSCFCSGIPRMANIVHTAKQMVKAKVDEASTE